MEEINPVKDFWNTRPCNIRHSKKDIGSKEYFDEVEKKKFFVEPHIKTFSQFERWSGKKVLEIGCGIGTAAINFARFGADYTGVELSSKSLELTQQRFNVYNQTGKFYEGNAEELTNFLPAEKYDLIYSWGVIHHTPNPKKAISEISKYLSKDGVLKIMLYSSESWKNYMISIGLDQPEAQYGCPIAYTYTEDEIYTLFEDYFDIINIDKDHIFPYQIEPYKKGEYVKQPWFETMPDIIFKVLEKKIGWHLLITAKSKTI